MGVLESIIEKISKPEGSKLFVELLIAAKTKQVINSENSQIKIHIPELSTNMSLCDELIARIKPETFEGFHILDWALYESKKSTFSSPLSWFYPQLSFHGESRGYLLWREDGCMKKVNLQIVFSDSKNVVPDVLSQEDPQGPQNRLLPSAARR